jgi:hypothetical protein
LQQSRAQLVLVGIAILLDEPVGEQGLQEPVNGGPGQLEAIRQLADTKPSWPGRERLENARGAVDRLNRSSLRSACSAGPGSGAMFRSIRYCRIHFDTVD